MILSEVVLQWLIEVLLDDYDRSNNRLIAAFVVLELCGADSLLDMLLQLHLVEEVLCSPHTSLLTVLLGRLVRVDGLLRDLGLVNRSHLGLCHLRLEAHRIMQSKVHVRDWRRIDDIILIHRRVEGSQLSCKVVHVGHGRNSSTSYHLTLFLLFDYFGLGHLSLSSVVGIVGIASGRLLTSLKSFEDAACFELAVLALVFPASFVEGLLSKAGHDGNHMRTEVEVLSVLLGDCLASPLLLVRVGEAGGDKELHLISLLFLCGLGWKRLLHCLQSLHLVHKELLLRRGVYLRLLDYLESVLHSEQLAVVSDSRHRLPHIKRVLEEWFDWAKNRHIMQ